MEPRTKKILRSILLLLGSILLGAVLYVYITLHNSLPPREGTITCASLTKPVEITFDSLNIPQIWAENEHDALFSLGWLHASDRLFQMELMRRISQGKLSELLGNVTLKYDIDARRIGHHRLAEKALATLSEENRQRLQAYADGINAYVKSGKALPFELQLLGIQFADWTVKDCLTASSFQTWFSNSLQNRDNWFLELYKTKGPAAVAGFHTNPPDWVLPTVPNEQKTASLDIREQFRHSVATALLSTLDAPTGGSNSWVISPGKSTSNAAIFASDPHLEVGRLPQFWYTVGVHVANDSSGIVGISLPGLPYVVMGHNGHSAFAFTVGGIDITEYYRETINAKDSMQYYSGTSWRNFAAIPETIWVRGNDSPYVEHVLFSHHGPVVWKDTLTQTYITQRWAGYDADLNQSISSVLALRTVRTYEDFRHLVTTCGALDANWMYADDKGNIGYQLGTPIPIRRAANTNLPLDGSDTTNEWLGYHPLEETPHAYNPARGWLATCNNIPDKNLPYELAGTFATDRIMRISYLLDSSTLVSAADCERFQLDRVDAGLLRWKMKAADLLRAIQQNELADSMASWNGSTELNSRQTALIQLFLRHLKTDAYTSIAGDSLASGVRTIWIEDQFLNGTDTTQHALVDSLERDAMREAIADLQTKRWGDINSLTMQHPFAEVPIVRQLLGLRKGPWPWSGSAGTLNASFVTPAKEGTFKTIVAPSWRFVVDFSKLDSATMVLPAGESGNPMSDHFFDFFPFWQSGQRWIVPFSQNLVFSRSKTKLILSPTPGN